MTHERDRISGAVVVLALLLGCTGREPPQAPPPVGQLQQGVYWCWDPGCSPTYDPRCQPVNCDDNDVCTDDSCAVLGDPSNCCCPGPTCGASNCSCGFNVYYCINSLGGHVGQVCRASMDSQCDAPEVCDGFSPCPPEGNHNGDGVACSDTTPNDCFAAACDAGLCRQNWILRGSGYVCRNNNNQGCDLADTCTGTNGLCPDKYQDAGVQCRAPLNVECDVGETCTGASPACPTETGHVANGTTCTDTSPSDCALAQCSGGQCSQTAAYRPASWVCRAPNDGGCDVAETCTGASFTCPGDVGVVAGTQCRPAINAACDAPETCTGTSAPCPAEGGHAAAGTTCPDSTPTDCTLAACNGNGTCDQTYGFQPSSRVCRNAVGPCDAPENCTGSSAGCPSDLLRDSSAICRNAMDPDCDAPERCDGVSTTCPGESGHVLDGTPCTDTTPSNCIAAACAAGTCNQSSGLAPSSWTCRPAVSPCDVPETCTGASGTCPPDQVADAGIPCRAELNVECDNPEVCNGVSPACPAEGNHRPNGGTCTDVNPGDCSTSACRDGLCAQDAGLQYQGYPCRPSVGACDVAEACSGASGACPPDSLVDAGVVCRAATGGCDLEERCDGAAGACPTDQRAGSTLQCRAPSCTNGVATLSASCYGGPDCPVIQYQTCTSGCVGTACGVNCVTDPDCAATQYCGAGLCLTKKSAGEICGSNGQCLSGFCVDSVCCTSACTDQCAACDVPGSQGSCVAVTGAPRGARAACSGTGVCKGACNGVTLTACTFPGTSTTCAPPSCTAGQATAASKCGGAGTCVAPAATPCGAYACAATACNTGCSTAADCAPGLACEGWICVTPDAGGGGGGGGGGAAGGTGGTGGAGGSAGGTGGGGDEKPGCGCASAEPSALVLAAALLLLRRRRRRDGYCSVQ